MTKSDQVPLNAFYAPTLLPAFEELLARGVAAERIEAVFRRSLFELRTPFLRVPLVLSRRFWEMAAAETGDAAIGLAAGRRFLSTLTNGLTYLFDAATSLSSACAYFNRYFPFFNGHFRAEIHIGAEAVELRLLDSGSLRASAQTTHYILIGICSLVRRKLLASGLARDPVLAVHLTQPRPADAEACEQHFRASVRWGQPYPALLLDPALFVHPLTPGNHELERTLESLLQQAEANSEPTLLEQLCDYLVSDLAAGASLQGFCQSRHLLERTAARRLKALGWTFSELLDNYRRCLAQDLLQETGLELVEISDRLGYSDVQNLNRACLRWFGCGPGIYRSRTTA
jgi:AraC-like DNA-binding protein